ncbi:Pex12 amino terminal region-domain-containing protein [Hypoxylon fragiforme]|uniref:Pex12 amino terminal region-domain-containing protein n=1 Tax=Hypoxylon fragiforme TaxID=63214 RepID=UPI0020C600E3|nr:Pex12 amino terminal region-domain-containing protein [Hypoxylon fragiforme]KAI2613575.1 Pex12 amino terminal region-domain-containing protein [Hypoxylon fragiforme]
MASAESPPASTSLAPSPLPSSSASSPPASSPYPYAFAPDIIRAHQKDVYFQGVLTNQITDLHRRLLGARSAHSWATETGTIADLLYLCLTTLLGNRTLGEEYCGLVQVEAEGGALPALSRRAAYIAGSILAPYGLSRLLPKIRARIRTRLQRNLGLLPGQEVDQDDEEEGEEGRIAKLKARRTWSYKVQAYLLANLTSFTSPSPIHAVGLALFYFSGSYYELAKRLAGLRYIFTHKIGERSDRAGYELLGVLLVVQMGVQGYLHARSTLASFATHSHPPSSSSLSERSGSGGGILSRNVSLDGTTYASNNELLLGANGGDASISATPGSRIDVFATTHTPQPPPGAAARYDLAEDETMRWVKGSQQRKCTLCLEELKDPAATQCGHVFCWSCIGDWVREKPECPLCRREALVQHILPLRAV